MLPPHINAVCSLDGQQGYSSRVEVPALYDRPFSHQVRAFDDSDSHKEQRLSYRDARCNWFNALSDVVNAQADALSKCSEAST